MTPVLVFDVETVPDVAGLRKLYGVAVEVSDEQVATMAFQRRRQATGNDFLQLHLQRVVRKIVSIGASGIEAAWLLELSCVTG